MSQKHSFIILNILSFLQRANRNKEKEPSPSLQWKGLEVDLKVSSTKQINTYTKQFVHQGCEWFLSVLYTLIQYHFHSTFFNHAFPTHLSSVTEHWHSSAKWLTQFLSCCRTGLCTAHQRKKQIAENFHRTQASYPIKWREEPINSQIAFTKSSKDTQLSDQTIFLNTTTLHKDFYKTLEILILMLKKANL